MSERVRTLILTDNAQVAPLALELAAAYDGVSVSQSPGGRLPDLPEIDVSAEQDRLAEDHDLLVSLHCRQIFPASLVRRVRCVNVHPGFNPDNRGVYPQVFAIARGGRVGATIHVMDERIDHGPIIAQREVSVLAWDTSLSVYERILAAERDLLREWFPRLLTNEYKPFVPEAQGTVNRRADFRALCELDPDEAGTLGEFVDRLRALTHGDLPNAYFVAPDGTRVHVRLVLEPEENDADAG